MIRADRPFTHCPSPFDRETLESYTRRILTANIEPPDYPDRFAAGQGLKLATPEGHQAWIEHLRAKTGRPDLAFEPDPTGWLRHPDGSGCPECADLLTVRALCTECTGGAHITVYANFDAPVCREHERWIGFQDQPAEQMPAGPGQLAAARRFGELVAEHQLDVHLYTMLLAAARAESPERSESELFGPLVAIIDALTRAEEQWRFTDPTISFADAFAALTTIIGEAATEPRPGIARAAWLYLRPAAARLRHARLRQEPFLPTLHGFPLASDVIENYRLPKTMEPFEHYLEASADTIESALGFARHRFDAPRTTPPGARTAELICPRGHSYLAEAITPLRADGTSPATFLRRCPTCMSFEVRPGETDLATIAPDLAAELDTEANGGLIPSQIPGKSKWRLWWRCRFGHRFQASPSNRIFSKSGCDICAGRRIVAGINDFATLDPEAAGEVATDCPLDITTMGINSPRSLEWICRRHGHSYRRSVRQRMQGAGCPFCARLDLVQSKQSLLDTDPEIARDWHPEWNKSRRPEHFTRGSREEVWWLCRNCNQPFRQRISARTIAKAGCGICVNRKCAPGYNDLLTLNPRLVLEWDYSKNPIRPDQTAAVTKRFHWRCLAHGHEVQVSFQDRLRAGGCGLCLDRAHRILERTVVDVPSAAH